MARKVAKGGGGHGRHRWPVVLNIRGRGEWRDALESLAVGMKLSSSELVEQAIREWAERRELTPPPSRTEEG